MWARSVKNIQTLSTLQTQKQSGIASELTAEKHKQTVSIKDIDNTPAHSHSSFTTLFFHQYDRKQ